jgi:hypothetical protein
MAERLPNEQYPLPAYDEERGNKVKAVYPYFHGEVGPQGSFVGGIEGNPDDPNSYLKETIHAGAGATETYDIHGNRTNLIPNDDFAASGARSRSSTGHSAEYNKHKNNVSEGDNATIAGQKSYFGAGQYAGGTTSGSFHNDTGGNSYKTSSGDAVSWHDGDIHSGANGNYCVGTGGNRVENVGGEYWVYSQGNLDFGSDLAMHLGSEGAMTINTTTTMNLSSVGAMSVDSKSTLDVKAIGPITINGSATGYIKTTAGLTLEAPVITLKSGSSTITLSASGITISGTTVTIKGNLIKNN